MSDTTPAGNIEMDASESSSLDRANTLSCEPEMQMPCLFGETISATSIHPKSESSAPAFVTKGRSSRLSLSDRLMQSLISAGLIKGITHSSIRKQSGAAIRASALWPLDGGDVEPLKADNTSLNDSNLSSTNGYTIKREI
jgi:hypothetical protein